MEDRELWSQFTQQGFYPEPSHCYTFPQVPPTGLLTQGRHNQDWKTRTPYIEKNSNRKWEKSLFKKKLLKRKTKYFY